MCRPSHRSFFRYLAAALVLAGAALPFSAQAEAEAARFQLRGVFEFGGGRSFSLHDAETGAGFWVELGKTYRGLRPVRYSEETKTLTLEYEGGLLDLTMATADGVPLEVVGGNEPEWHISGDDIDPEQPGGQSYQSARAKVRFNVGARKQVSQQAGSRPAAGAPGPTGTRATPTADSSDENASPPATQATPTSPTSPTSSEAIALEVYDKNYIGAQNPPRGVDIYYPVAPRR